MKIDLIQGSDAWHSFRANHIGASDIGTIMEHNPWKTPRKLWEEKVGKETSYFESTAMAKGKELEPIARDTYMRDSGILMTPDCYVYDEWEIASASLDGITTKGDKILEIKCPTNPKLFTDLIEGKIPQMYVDQVQWQLMCCGAKKATFMVYLDEFSYVLHNIEPDMEYQKKMLEKAKEFWAMVESKTPPKSKRDLAIVIESSMANTIANDLKEILLEENELKARLKDITEKKEKLKKQIREVCKENNCYFPKSGVHMVVSTSKGLIDWKKVSQSYNINESELEEFRSTKKEKVSFKITS